MNITSLPPRFVGDDPGQGRLAEARRPVEQHVVHTLAAPPGRLHRHPEAGDGLLLTHVLLERPRPQRPLELHLLGRRRAAQHPALLGRHAHDLVFAAA
jgi:hypothetical protein